ncbi:MAG: 5'-3' exonuclease H3TH domain-containing protein [Verrucomicrobiota bacterium]
MRWMLVDGFNLVFRSHFAMERSNLRRQSDQFPTGALHGWIKALLDLRDSEKPDRAAVFFDLGGSDRHLAAHPEYKAQRDDTPEDIVLQLPEVKRLTALLGFQVVERRGVEADDLIATAVRRLSAEGHGCVIVSADKDFGQCVGGEVFQLVPPPTANPSVGWRRLDAAGVTEKFGVPPARIADYLALVGDTSDNIPGLRGVGPKTAAKWIAEHGGLEQVLAAADRLEPARFRDQVRAEADRIRANLDLVTFRTDYELDLGEAPAEAVGGVERFLDEMEMQATLRRYRARHGKDAPEKAPAPKSAAKPGSASPARAGEGPEQGELF